MALKDWRKEKDNVVDFLWSKSSRSSYSGNYEVWVYKGKVDEKVMWIVRIKEIGMGGYTRQFKTKPQALAFAKSYMANNGASPVEQVEAKLKRMAGF